MPVSFCEIFGVAIFDLWLLTVPRGQLGAGINTNQLFCYGRLKIRMGMLKWKWDHNTIGDY